MRIEEVDPQELRRGQRRTRRSWIVGAAGATAVAFVVAVAIDGADADGQAGRRSTPANVASAEPASSEVALPLDPLGFEASSRFEGPPMRELYRRTTAAGIELTLLEGDDLMAMGGPGEPTALAPSAPDSAVPGAFVAAEWCFAKDNVGYRVGANLNGVVVEGVGRVFPALRNGPQVTVHTGEFAKGRPFRVMVMQVDAAATSASVRFSDGTTDAAVPKDGWVVLATPGAPDGQFVVTIESAGQRTEFDWSDIPTELDAEWIAACKGSRGPAGTGS